MKGSYYLRIVAAWLLLKLASAVMKDAEQFFSSAVKSKTPSPSVNGASSPVEGEVVDAEVVANG